MPFRQNKALGTFQTFIDVILSKVGWQFALVYLDDIVVFSNTAEENLTHILYVFHMLSESGVTLKL